MKAIMLASTLVAMLIGLTAMNTAKRYKAPKDFAYIPSGKITLNDKTESVMGFYMSKYEVTNYEYNEFLNDLKEQNRTDDYEKAKHQTDKWVINGKYIAPYAKMYHQHPAYEKYPVVTISKEGAELFCAWKAKKLEELAKGKWKITVRLPVEEEWILAAKGGVADVKYGWGDNELKNKKGYHKANYRSEGNQDMHVTAPVQSYQPNGYGLYNMSGNVAEFTKDAKIIKGGSWNDQLEDITITSTNDYEETVAPFIGFRPVLVLTLNN